MTKIIRLFERYMVVALIFLMMAAVLFGTIELGITLINKILEEPRFLLNTYNLLDIFGSFFMILIGLELLETIKAYIVRDQIHVEVVFLVAMIAIARKVIILEMKSMPPLTLIGIASIIIALSGGYYLIKKSFNLNAEGRPSDVG